MLNRAHLIQIKKGGNYLFFNNYINLIFNSKFVNSNREKRTRNAAPLACHEEKKLV